MPVRRRTFLGLGAAGAAALSAALTTALLSTAGVVMALSPASAAPTGTGDTRQAEFQQVTLARGVAEMGEPMSLAVLPDRWVLHTSRDGTLRVTDPAGATNVAARLNVYRHDEQGLQGVAVDPDFTTNRFVYLYYSPALDTPPGDAPNQGSDADFEAWQGVNRLSRFTLNADHTLDTGSEVTVLDVPTDRGICCHAGGDIDFDATGNLYLTTGDNTNPFASDGYTPIDERSNRNPAYDAQRSAGNTNDLRGKLLRISVNDDGSYDIPEGNLFAPGTPNTRPEIYAMGFRNPFRMSVDRETGAVYVGDYGPDAGTSSPTRGPGGMVEFARVTEPGNFGWPYCVGDNRPYVDYDFATGASGATFDCSAPRNDSPNNTGQTTLPPARPGWISYDGGSFPAFGNGAESPMAGPVYHYDPQLNSSVKFPQEYDGDFFALEYGRRWIKNIDIREDGGPGDVSDIPWSGTQPMDAAFGPDGALYVLDYGTGWYAGDENSALYRIENVSGGLAPIAEATADPTSGRAPLDVAFSAEGSVDPDGDTLRYTWDFGDGGSATGADPSHTYTQNGEYTATLTVEDATGLTATASVRITVGNTAPDVTIELPADGQIVDFGDAVPYEITVTDPEDGAIDCSQVTLTFIVGHDSHGHPQTSATGCSGTLQTHADGEHDANANIFGVWDAEYTDAGGLTTHDQHVSQTSQRQAEHFGAQHGVEIASHTNAHGGRTVGYVDNGDWIAFEPYVLADATEFTARISSGGAGGTIEVRAGSPTGDLLGSVDVPNTGGWDTFQDVTTSLSGPPAGTTSLHLVFTGPTGSGYLFDVDDFTFGTGDLAAGDRRE
ncbi:carbohydrate-binding protein [Streptomyces sp. NPDC127098]|uniref:carbohydrate-binding protein n=1 Tax=Streptomyces sp. NPDC127098 TaxID=3347137 RepID=UPI00364CB84D